MIDIKPGFWLSRWHIDSQGYLNFNFEPELDLHWGTEPEAVAFSNALRQSAGIETTVVQIGGDKV